jgi:hypothetical protein
MGKISYNLYLASMGNKSERTIFILFSIIIGIFALIALVYLVISQKYITQFDFVLGIFALILDILVFFLSIFALVYIKSHEKNI